MPDRMPPRLVLFGPIALRPARNGRSIISVIIISKTNFFVGGKRLHAASMGSGNAGALGRPAQSAS
jgi:hypothetical protein